MYKYWLMSLAALVTLSAEAQSLDLYKICRGATATGMKVSLIDGQEYIVMDKGFCAEFMKDNDLKSKSLNDLKREILNFDRQQSLTPVNCNLYDLDHNDGLSIAQAKKTQDKWKLRFYASHSWTTYFNSNLKLNTSRYQIEIKDYEWAERSSREFFEWSTMTAKGNNPAQMIDEPTNTFVLSLEKNGFEFFLSAFHPKFLQAKNQVKHIVGTVDGVEIDRTQEVNQKFLDYTNIPGETKIVDNRSTHKQMTFEVGMSKRFTLIDSKFGKIVYVPGIGIGVMVGETVSVAVKPGEWWELEGATDKYGVQGYGGSFTNRIEFNTKNEKFGLFVENKLGMYKMKHGFLDGTQEYDLGFMGNSAGFKVMLWNPAKHKRKVKKPVEQ